MHFRHLNLRVLKLRSLSNKVAVDDVSLYYDNLGQLALK